MIVMLPLMMHACPPIPNVSLLLLPILPLSLTDAVPFRSLLRVSERRADGFFQFPVLPVLKTGKPEITDRETTAVANKGSRRHTKERERESEVTE